MDIIIEVIIGGIIARYLGLYTRYFFYKLIGKKKSLEYLSGKGEEDMNRVSHNMINAIIGCLIFLPLAVGIAYIYYSIFR